MTQSTKTSPMPSVVVQGVTILSDGERYQGSVRMQDGRIVEIRRGGELPVRCGDEVVDGNDAFLLPGVIDGHVHMREPGLTHKATMESETRAAFLGGVTSVLDMPNVVPQTTTLQLLDQRYALAQGRCHVNYGFFLGATNDNIEEIRRLDPTQCPGVKLFMGSSTGNMLVDREETLRSIFRYSPALIVAHCEDTERIKEREKRARSEGQKRLNETAHDEGQGHAEHPEATCIPFQASSCQLPDDLPARFHPLIRDHLACLQSSSLAVRLAREEGAHLHVAHLTTARELELFQPGDERITAEACVPHLLFSDKDYDTLGSLIKCNPAIKTEADRDALRKALSDGRIRTVATDHAPHLLGEKQGGCLRAMSGMPMVQFSLPAMLTLADEGVLSLERVVELMCHNPARLYGLRERGFIREGYRADVVMVRRHAWTVTRDCVASLCAWSPLEGRRLKWQVEHTWVGGISSIECARGERLHFQPVR